MSDSEDEYDDLTDPQVTTKYRMAADVANAALAHVMAACVPGKRVVELCTLGDKFIADQVATILKKTKTKEGKSIEKGIAFPTCISCNRWVASVSPLGDSTWTVEAGDLVKLELGVHVDGYCAIGGHSFVCPAEGATEGAAQPPPAEGRVGEVIEAAHVAAECALRLLRPGKTNDDVTHALSLVAEEFNCEPIEKLVSYQLKRYVPNGKKQVLNRALDKGEQNLECGTFEFEQGEVYAIDIRMSTGTGRIKLSPEQPTVYKRQVDEKYVLKTKTARQVFGEVNERFPTMPFSLRHLSNETAAKFAIRQMMQHQLVEPYALYLDRQDDAVVAVARFTAMITSSQTLRITPPADFTGPRIATPHDIKSNEIKQILQMSTKRNKKKNKSKAAAAPQPMDDGGD